MFPETAVSILLHSVPTVVTGVIASFITAAQLSKNMLTRHEFDLLVKRLDTIESRIDQIKG